MFVSWPGPRHKVMLSSDGEQVREQQGAIISDEAAAGLVATV